MVENIDMAVDRASADSEDDGVKSKLRVYLCNSGEGQNRFGGP